MKEKFIPLDVDDAFELYMRKAHPRVAEQDTQYKESRRVFFAGAAVMYYHLAYGVTALPDEVGLKELKLVEAQLEEFYERVRTERD